jgi:hypothetical protein
MIFENYVSVFTLNGDKENTKKFEEKVKNLQNSIKNGPAKVTIKVKKVEVIKKELEEEVKNQGKT